MNLSLLPYLLVSLIGFALALGATPLVRLRAGGGQWRGGSHNVRGPEKPRVGGMIIFFAFALAPVLAALALNDAAAIVGPKWREFTGLLAASLLVFLAGYADDVHELNWLQKSGSQVAAALVLWSLGYRLGDISLPGGISLDFGIFDAPVTVAWVWLVTNAINLIDGHDGVAGGVTALAAFALAFIAWDLDHPLQALWFAALAGAVTGFLPFNFPAASRYLGDSGGQLLGFLMAELAISGFVDETGRVPLYIPAAALAVPLLDITLAFTRRLLNGQHPMRADLDHVHHRIERLLGYGPKRLALSLYGYSGLFAVAALALHAYRGTPWAWASGASVLVLVAVFLVRLGYHRTLAGSRYVQAIGGRIFGNSRPGRPPQLTTEQPPSESAVSRQDQS